MLEKALAVTDESNTSQIESVKLKLENAKAQLKAEGKPFEYQIFEAISGGHSFDRMDTKIGKEIRLKVHLHLSKYLKPEKPFKSFNDLQKAAYKF